MVSVPRPQGAPRRHGLLLAALLAAMLGPGACATAPGDLSSFSRVPRESLERPAPGTRVGDFSSEALYLRPDGRVAGTRWVHAGSGMAVTILRVPSIPQAMVSVWAPPVSDRGESHLGEHLLLVRGAKGVRLWDDCSRSFIQKNAFTGQTDVVYGWACSGGTEAFLASLGRFLDAILLPDYTDEEVRREAYFVEARRDPVSGRPVLAEAGDVYTEVATREDARHCAMEEMDRLLAGEGHPLSFQSGGSPQAVRQLRPGEVRAFHDSRYVPGAGLAMVLAIPPSVPEDEALIQLSSALRNLCSRPELRSRKAAVPSLPPPNPSADRTPRIVPFPSGDPTDYGMAVLAWPLIEGLAPAESLRARLLLATLASGETSALANRLREDPAWKRADLPGRVQGYFIAAGGWGAARVTMDGFSARLAGGEELDRLRSAVRGVFAKVAGLPPGSPELAEVDRRARSVLDGMEKELRWTLSAPPGFGVSDSAFRWLDHLRSVDGAGGYERSFLLDGVFREVRAGIGSGANSWTSVAARLGLGEEPRIVVSVPRPEGLAREIREREERLSAFERDLRAGYGGAESDAALVRYEAECREAALPRASPGDAGPASGIPGTFPVDLDPYATVEALPGGVPGSRVLYEGASGVEIALALDLRQVPPSQYIWLPILPGLLTEAGVETEGGSIPGERMWESFGQDVYGVWCRPDVSVLQGRYELVLRAEGDGASGGAGALRWLERCLRRSRLGMENLDRLRSLVSGGFAGASGTAMSGLVPTMSVATALRGNADPLLLSLDSPQAAVLHLWRLNFQLAAPPAPEQQEAVDEFLDELPSLARESPAKTISAITTHLEKHAPTGGLSRLWVESMAEWVGSLVQFSAPGSIQGDLRRIVKGLRRDMRVGPGKALQGLDELRRSLLTKGRVRFVVTGSRECTDPILPGLQALYESFAPGEAPAPPRPRPSSTILERIADREGSGSAPAYFALVRPDGSPSGFIFLFVDGSVIQAAEDVFRDRLAFLALGGWGRHGVSMRLRERGLLYAVEMGGSDFMPGLFLAGDRCRDIVETMKAIRTTAEEARGMDPGRLLSYAAAQLVPDPLATARYEERSRWLAEWLGKGDGRPTLESLREFRRGLGDRLAQPGLAEDVRERLASSLGRLLPGSGIALKGDPRACLLVAAPEAEIARWEAWLREREGPDARVHRVYPADFWVFPEE